MPMKASVADLIKSIKAKGCYKCGYASNYSALSFGHIDPSTKYRSRTGRIVQPSELFDQGREYSDKVIMAEIAKCRVICANCHMEETYPHNAIA
jgi:hypothetical protein